MDLFVKEAYRRKGIARSLVQEISAISARQGCKIITVQALAKNEEANSFYIACGAKLDKGNLYYFSQEKIAML